MSVSRRAAAAAHLPISSSSSSSPSPSPQVGSSGTTLELWEDLFAHPSDWWDNRLDKKTPRHPDFRHKLSRQVLWLNDWHRPPWVDSRLPALSEHISTCDRVRMLCEQDQPHSAILALLSCTLPSVALDIDVYARLLKAFGNVQALPEIKLIHAALCESDLPPHGLLADHLIMALANCSALDDARHVLLSLPSRSVYAWTALIAGYTASDQPRDALYMFRCMQEDGVEPDPHAFVSALKACACIPDLQEAKKLHADARERGLTSNTFVGSALVSLYGKCGNITEAATMFNELSGRNAVSWGAMLSAYLEQGQPERVLQLYRQMKEEGVDPSQQVFVITLQACCICLTKAKPTDNSIQLMCLEIGHALHVESLTKNFLSDGFVPNMLLTLYNKCRSNLEAESVFHAILEHDAVSWNAMLFAHVDRGQGEQALQLYKQMQVEGVCPNQQTFMLGFQACIILAGYDRATFVEEQMTQKIALEIGQALHSDAWTKGFFADVFIGNSIINMYGKCGSSRQALGVFNELPERDIVSWNVMLSVFVQEGQGEKTLRLYRHLEEGGVSPNQLTFVLALQACVALADLSERQINQVSALEVGRALHADAQRKGFTSDMYVNNTLVHMYGECGSLSEAEIVFAELHESDIVSWTAMLSLYMEQDQGEKALQLYRQMLEEGHIPDLCAFVIALQACGTLVTPDEARIELRMLQVVPLEIVRALHADACRNIHLDMFIENTMISMYGKCGSLKEAETVFSGLPNPDLVSWSAMLSVYVEQGQGEKALHLFRQMKMEGVRPNQQIFVIALQACCTIVGEDDTTDGQQLGQAMSLEIGRALHADAKKEGLTKDGFVGSILLSMYSKCGSIMEAENLFHGLSECDIVLWNSLLSVYLEQDLEETLFQAYKKMHEEGISPDHQTFSIALQACGALVQSERTLAVVNSCQADTMPLDIGRALHADAQKCSFLSDMFLCNAILNMYSKCGSIVEAEDMFDGMSARNSMSWSTMLSTYIEQGQGENALQLYRQMKVEGAALDETTLVRALEGSWTTGSIEICRQLHFNVVVTGCDDLPIWGRAVIRAYGGCACMADAQTVFDRMPQRDVMSWTAYLAVYAQEGNLLASLKVFQEMQGAGVTPNGVTFLLLLFACSRAGFVDKGVELFESMSRQYDIIPNLKHYVAMVDLLARAGEFGRMRLLLLQMPVQTNWSIWMCVLGACHKYGNVRVARWAFDNAVALRPVEAGPYVLMSSIYMDAGLQHCVDEIEHIRLVRTSYARAVGQRPNVGSYHFCLAA